MLIAIISPIWALALLLVVILFSVLRMRSW